MTDTVARRVRDRLGRLTPAERRIGSALLERYPTAGLASVSELAESAGVSGPTVVRTARKLGYDGFGELQRALHDEVAEKFRDPIERRERRAGPSEAKSDTHVLHRFADAATANVHQTLRRIDTDVFDRVVARLASPRTRVHVVGGRITHVLAEHLCNHLRMLRPHVTWLGTSAEDWPQHAVDMDARSVLVIFDVRRYEARLLELARLVDERGAEIVLVTDPWGSPIERVATRTLGAFIETPSAWDSAVAPLLLVEALVAAVQERAWKRARPRIEALETMFGRTRPFRRVD